MPIRPPAIADLTYDQLVQELVSRIPAHTPEWTNPRLGDPGRTLIDLFAWLGDALLYRANLVPERQRLAFLQLLGTGMRPAVPASGLASASFADEARTAPLALRAFATVPGKLPFEAVEEITVLPLQAECYAKRVLTDEEAEQQRDVIDGLQTVYSLSGPPLPYVTTRLFGGGAADENGFDIVAQTIDGSLWIALLAAKPALVAAVRGAVKAGIAGSPARASIGLAPRIRMPDRFDELPPRVPIPVAWETCVSVGGKFEMMELDAADRTDGLKRSGVMRLALPTHLELARPDNDLRANLQAGVGDLPPRIDDPDLDARLVGWLRMRPRQPRTEVASLAFTWAGLNVVELEQRQTITARILGVSDGGPNQAFQLPGTSVERATLELEVEEGGRFFPWQCVDDLATLDASPVAAREARAFTLDAEAGLVRFGDNVRGRVPEQQARVRVRRMRAGGGRGGNLPAGTLKALSGSDVEGNPAPALKLNQPLATTGGEDPETLAQAEARIPARLRHGDRVVTPEDYRRIALDTPGVDVARVEVLPRFKPQQRRADVPGVVSVMALPARPVGPAPNPRPDRVFLETLYAYLDARRPLATELYAIGCEYIALGITIAVGIREGYGPDTVLQAVRDALRKLLWPVPPGGPGGEGWPLGRAVRDRELDVEVSRVEGVADVAQINLFARDGTKWKALPMLDACGTQQLGLEPWQLPELLSIVVVAGDTAPSDPGALRPAAGPNAVGVPVVPEVC